MAGNPEVLGLLEELLDSGNTPEDVCSGRPELLKAARRTGSRNTLLGSLR